MLFRASPAVKFYTMPPSDINLRPQSWLAIPKVSDNLLLAAFSKQLLSKLSAFSDMAQVYPKFVIVYIYLWDQTYLKGLKKQTKVQKSFQLLLALCFQNYHLLHPEGVRWILGHLDVDPESRLQLPSGVTVLICFRAACPSPQSTQIVHGLL